jgi:predicted metal-binding membrane protein
MKDLKFVIFLLVLIIFSGLGVSMYMEGMDCTGIKNKGVCVSSSPNNIIIISVLIFLIVFLVMIKENN